ncbi:MAG: hypothetical protein ABFC88_12560 [Thermoguttaceae bacterium]
MRIPKALSYSALALWEKNPDDFYTKYLSPHSPPREPQTPPMSVGSSFDAYVKADLHAALFGAGANPKFAFQAIFEDQVEPQCRDFALTAGKVVYDAYKVAGAYDALLAELQKSVEPPRFEFKIDGTIGGAPFTGKPDCRFVLDLGEGRIHCIYDWKVHGYCGKYNTSPSKGYMVCLDGFTAAKPSKSHGKEHSAYLAFNFRGMTINSGYMEFCSNEYADQLSLYGWLLGEKVGDENVVCGIEEMCAKYMGEGEAPTLRYARHRGRVKSDYQVALEVRVRKCWDAIQSGVIFPGLSPEDNKARFEVLDQAYAASLSDGTELGGWFQEVTKAPRF